MTFPFRTDRLRFWWRDTGRPWARSLTDTVTVKSRRFTDGGRRLLAATRRFLDRARRLMDEARRLPAGGRRLLEEGRHLGPRIKEEAPKLAASAWQGLRRRAADPRTRRAAVRWAPSLAAMFILVFVLGSIKMVTIQADGHSLSWRTTAHSVQSLLRQARITLGQGDETDPPVAARLVSGATIVVRRAVPLTLTVDGKALKVTSARPTVQAMLEQRNITLGPRDRVSPGGDSPLEKDMAVKVVRVTERTVTETWAIPYERVEREDSGLALGRSKVVRSGQSGSQDVTVKYTYEDGVQTGSKIVNQKITAEPVAELVAVGTSGILNRGGTQIRFLKALDMIATAYDPGPISTGPYSDGYTAIGLKATYGVVAVDPRVIPLRSRLYVEGYGYAIAGDTGSAIKGNRIDLCFDTYDEAIRFGRRPVTVYILKYPN